MSKVLRGEKLDDCQSWLAPEVRHGESGNGLLTAGQMEALQEQARQEGFQQGLEEGRQAGAEQVEEKIRRLETLLGVLQDPVSMLDETVEQQLVELAMTVARQLVRREIRAEPEQVIAVVREALAVLPVASPSVQLLLHPEDVELVREALSMHDSEQTIRIVEDPVQTRGGCRVLTDTSQIDATVESRLNAVIASVLGGERRGDSQA